MLTLTETEARLAQLREDRAGLVKKYEADILAIDQSIEVLTQTRVHLLEGKDGLKLERAAKVLTLNVQSKRDTIVSGDRLSAVKDAIDDLARNQGKRLMTEFFGTKNYDRWIDQRDDCAYGFGPCHGSTVFAIGLRQIVRDNGISKEDAEAAIYALNLMVDEKLTPSQFKDIQKAVLD